MRRSAPESTIAISPSPSGLATIASAEYLYLCRECADDHDRAYRARIYLAAVAELEAAT